ncbi:MAG: apolipoprotein N-acyltransferase [Candidatus Aminicenantes bacterium]|nr:MAG: apolipoprotein N-acyltransferase [Candidatus Aminicenantes bacterium]
MKIRKSDIFLAVLSGTLTALSFPKFNLSFLAWISFIPLLFIIINKKPGQSFLLGIIAGISFNAILIYWIPAVPAHYGSLSFGFSLLIYFVFILFLALFWAFFCLLFSKIYQTFPKSFFILAPFLWISFEYILTYFLTGFPWGLLGYSQYKNIYFIQLAAITGIYGLSFILILFQSLFVFSMNQRKKVPFFIGLALVFLIHLWGFLSTRKNPQTENSFTASVIQGNVSSDIYWDQISYQETWNLFERHLDLTRRAHWEGSRLIIWPEFSVPLCFSCSSDIYRDFKETLFEFVQETDCTLLLGTNETSSTPTDLNYYNTALCLSPNLSTTQYYKMHLVPFGEYTPYKKIFFFIEKMTHAIGDITPGSEYILHRFEGKKFGSPICYEIIFPNLVRKFVKKGANFLVTITNDGWYGKSSAPYQHFYIAVFRAVENRRYLLRAATTGISGIVDPYGRILIKSELMTKAHLTGNITPSQTLTFYTKYGDILPLTGLTLSVLFLILAVIKRKYERKRAVP